MSSRRKSKPEAEQLLAVAPIIDIHPPLAVGETWLVCFPGEQEVRKVAIEQLTLNTCALRTRPDMGPVTPISRRFRLTEVSFVERVYER